MSELRDSGLTLELDRERFRISPDFLARYNRPGPRYTSYPTAPVWRDDFGPDDLEARLRASRCRRHPDLALHAPALLREPVPVLRLQRGHHQGSQRRAALSRHARTRDRPRCRARFALSSDRAVSLGRRHAHLPDARADGRPLRLHRRAILLRARRRNRHRSRSARHQRAASGNAAPPGLQSAEHGHPGFRSRSAASRQSRAAARDDVAI